MKNTLSSTLNWDIQAEPLLLSGKIIGDKKAILRNDNGSLLGIVGKDYFPVSNQSLLELSKLICKAGEFELKGFDEINNGRVILAFLQNKNPNLKLNNCVMREFLIIGNSHDGTRPFYIGTGSTLIRCENQFYSTLKVFRKKHTSPLEYNEVLASQIVRLYKQKKSQVYGVFDGMEQVPVRENQIRQMIKEIERLLNRESKDSKKENSLSPSMQTLRACIDREMRELGNNAFGLFNGVTWYTSHEMRNSESVFGRIGGTAYQINQKAYKFCMQLKNAYFKPITITLN